MTHMSFDSAWGHAAAADGWLTRAQGSALYHAAAEVAPGQWIVEIGSHCGRSAVILAAAKRRGVQLLAVDPFDDPRWGGGPDAFGTFQATLRAADLYDDVVVFRGLSVDAAQASDTRTVGLLFIDGAHDEASVLADIDGWSPRLADSSVVMLHDAYSSPGVTVALFRRFFCRRSVRYAGSTGSLTRVEVTTHNRLRSLQSMVPMAMRLAWFARNLLVKSALRRRWYWMPPLLRHEGRDYPY